jgi:hypothetical protein
MKRRTSFKQGSGEAKVAWSQMTIMMKGHVNAQFGKAHPIFQMMILLLFWISFFGFPLFY